MPEKLQVLVLVLRSYLHVLTLLVACRLLGGTTASRHSLVPYKTLTGFGVTQSKCWWRSSFSEGQVSLDKVTHFLSDSRISYPMEPVSGRVAKGIILHE